MTAQDHNKTLVIIYGFLGFVLIVVGIILVITNEVELSKIKSDSSLLASVLIGLILIVLLLLTAYGLFKRKAWARIPALILAGLFVWLVPLGTALAIYTWWFMFSEGAKHLYSGH